MRSSQSPQTRLISGLPHAFRPHAGQVYFVLLAAFFFRASRVAPQFDVAHGEALLGSSSAQARSNGPPPRDVVAHLLPGFLAARLRRCRWGSGPTACIIPAHCLLW